MSEEAKEEAKEEKDSNQCIVFRKVVVKNAARDSTRMAFSLFYDTSVPTNLIRVVPFSHAQNIWPVDKETYLILTNAVSVKFNIENVQENGNEECMVIDSALLTLFDEV